MEMLQEASSADGRKRILVVDDDGTIVDLIRDALSPDYIVATAESYAEAMAYLAGEPCDLVITDLGMPLLSGAELIHAIRQSSLGDIPIIAMSAYPQLQELVKGFNLQGMLPKPFALEDLSDCVAKALGEPPPDRETVQNPSVEIKKGQG